MLLIFFTLLKKRYSNQKLTYFEWQLERWFVAGTSRTSWISWVSGLLISFVLPPIIKITRFTIYITKNPPYCTSLNSTEKVKIHLQEKLWSKMIITEKKTFVMKPSHKITTPSSKLFAKLRYLEGRNVNIHFLSVLAGVHGYP